MRIVRFALNGHSSWGILGDGGRITATSSFDPAIGTGMSAAPIPLADVKLLAPIAPRRNIFCLGKNYVEHIREGAGGDESLPPLPIWFSKSISTINDPEGEIVIDPALTSQVDWEVELAVIIGRGGKNIDPADALDYVFGYTVFNDVSARDQQRSRGAQFFYGKNLDGFGPAGPWIVTSDVINDPQGLDLILRVNGEERQHGHTSDMIFDVRSAIADLSAGITLMPGDVIATGTPHGTGMGMRPQVWLQHGDVVEAEIPGIGVLRNHVRISTSEL